jgi:antitoxin FitA
MTNVQVRNVEAELHESLRQRAAEEGRTISEYVLELIRRDLRRPVRREWLRELAALPPVGDSSAHNLDALHAARADR